MAKTIIIDTEVKGVEQAIDDINKIDNAVDGVNQKSISPKFDSAKTEKSLENLQKILKEDKFIVFLGEIYLLF